MIIWNLVHGCHRKSEGCKHCYVFTRDEENGVDTNLVRKTASFNLPLCRDLRFYMVTKRPERILQCLPPFWNEISDRITICCTMENQRRVDERLPVLLSLPLPHKEIIVEPMLGSVDFHGNLEHIACVTVGGESGRDARPCRYEWVLDVRRQCMDAGVHFHFMQTGACFIKDGKTYRLLTAYRCNKHGRLI